MPDLDLRPRVVFHTSAGAVVVLVDPTTATTGMAVFPIIGSVPYAVDFDPTQLFPQPRIRLDFPTGPYYIPIDLTGLGGGGGGSINIPGLGDATYEVVLGPPDIPPDQLVSAWSLASFGLSQYWPYLLIGLGVVFMLSRRR